MTAIVALQHHFVDFIPDDLADGHVYVSMEYATVVHRCCCGCGAEVVTPLSPDDWRLSFDGESVSLAPSIGNWSFPCRSHYWIRDGRVVWARTWSEREVAMARAGVAIGASGEVSPLAREAIDGTPGRRVARWVRKALRRS